MGRIQLVATALILSFSLSIRSWSQESVRPKIGYVFSGGGAKGAAHVGVLKVLEEVGLQPDYITGTSMGSIMGGLYAIGYSADEISRLIEEVDWSKLLTNEIPSDQVMMRRKHEYSRFVVEMPIYDGKPSLPSGLIEGQKLSALFSELAWRQAGVDDFHDFPVPFTCIGTDILNGGMVEMSSGDLSSAMRASMAIPSVFSAVKRDSNQILVDGGVVRNFPVQEAIQMGADKIIGVYVGFDSKMTPDQLRSLTSVITRTSLLSGAEDVASQMPLVDILIVPDLEGFTPASFSDGVKIMNRAAEAAREQYDRLKAFADSVNSLAPPPARDLLSQNDSLFLPRIRVLTQTESLSRFIIKKSGIMVGQWLHPKELNLAIDRIFGTLFFDKVEYYFEKLDLGYGLVFRVKEKPRSSLSAAIHYDNHFGPSLIASYTLLNSLLDGSRLGLTADISGNPQFRGYYDIHLGTKRDFIGSLFLNAQRERLPFFRNNLDIGNYNHSLVYGGIGFRQALGTNQHIGADIYYHYANLRLSRNIKEVLPQDDVAQWLDNIEFIGPEARFIYEHNSFDNGLYPTRGITWHLKYRQALRTHETYNISPPDSLDLGNKLELDYDPYWHATMSYEQFIPIGSKVSINPGIGMGLSKNDKPFVDNYYVGGYKYYLRENQVPFIGLNNHELLVGNYLGGKLGLQWHGMSNLYVNALANLIFVSDNLENFPDEIMEWNSEARFFGIGLGLTYRTPLGPISLYSGSRTDVWNPIWYFSIGYTF
jgi:NTE family protein